jgi:hypothetical protein
MIMRINDNNAQHMNGKKWIIGILLIAAGGALLLEHNDINGIWQFWTFWHWWPLFIALFGLLKIAFGQGWNDTIRGISQILFAAWLYLCIEHLWGWSFTTTWPVVLIIGGASMILRATINARSN